MELSCRKTVGPLPSSSCASSLVMPGVVARDAGFEVDADVRHDVEATRVRAAEADFFLDGGDKVDRRGRRVIALPESAGAISMRPATPALSSHALPT